MPHSLRCPHWEILSAQSSCRLKAKHQHNRAALMSQTEAYIDELDSQLRGLTMKEIDEHPSKSREQFAMEFFELATAKEQINQFSDAADFYRKSYKLDEKVDLKYREKHFKKKPAESNSESAPAKPTVKLNLGKIDVAKLLQSFETSEILPENEEEPVPISILPNEIIEHIMIILLNDYTPSWVNLSLACKKFAFIGFHNKNIWRVLAEKLVYPNQVYKLEDCDEGGDEDESEKEYGITPEETQRRFEEQQQLQLALVRSQWGFNFKKMLAERPFLKYQGVYISKVTYMREGGRAENSNGWNLPLRIITYYRYYRFYPDGTCLKMMSIVEPAKVVRRLHKGFKVSELEIPLPEGPQHHLQHHHSWLQVRRGTFTITLDGHVETNCEGSVPQYRFIDKFKIVHGGRHTRHSKLEWLEMGFYNPETEKYNTLSRENERDFIFSRVRSYAEAPTPSISDNK